jgi:hypothetical protein
MNRARTSECRLVARLAFLLPILLLPGALAAQDVWRTGISDKTTEAQIVRDFGAPVRVEILPDAFTAIREGKAANYRFFYDLTIGNNLLDGGPLGEAGSVTVYFAADRKVQRVQWKYTDGYRYHKRTQESRTPITKEQIEALAGKSPVTTTKLQAPPPDAEVYDFEISDVQVRIFYLGTGNEVTAMVTYR